MIYVTSKIYMTWGSHCSLSPSATSLSSCQVPLYCKHLCVCYTHLKGVISYPVCEKRIFGDTVLLFLVSGQLYPWVMCVCVPVCVSVCLCSKQCEAQWCEKSSQVDMKSFLSKSQKIQQHAPKMRK